MDDGLPNFKYQKNKDWSLNERLRQYELKFKGPAAFQIRMDIQDLNTEGVMNFDQTFCCIKILTMSFDLFPNAKYVPGRLG